MIITISWGELDLDPGWKSDLQILLAHLGTPCLLLFWEGSWTCPLWCGVWGGRKWMDILIWITIHNKPGSTNHHTSTDLFTVSSGLQLCYMQGHKRCSLVIRHLLHFYIGIRYHFHVNRGSSCVCILCIIHMDRMDAMYYTTGVELWRAALSDHIIANDFAGLAE